MTHLLPGRASFFASFVLSLLLVVALAFAAPALADNEDVVTPDGDNGANAGQVVSTSTAATSTDGTGGQHDVGGTIETGDATATTTIDNTVNINDVDPDTACDPLSENTDEQCTNSSTITASSTNEALVENFATSTASTGDNVAEGGEGLATVVSGNAFAFANVINLINTNIFNSQGLLLFLNQIFSTGLDLRDYNLDYFFDGEAGASPTVNEDTGEPQCTLLTCLNSSSLNVLSGNTATVTNSVIVRADAGGNTATTSQDGDATIDTGDAYAAANVVNLVNTNIINSSYLMVSFNNFGDLDGNITLPGGDFFTRLFAHGGQAPEMNASSYGVYNDNVGTTTGTIVADANTGSSTASTTGEGSGIIMTGDAHSQATEYTDLNGNHVGGTSAFFMFRVAGEWLGQVKSLPNGLNFSRMFDAATKDGITSTSTLVLVTSEEVDEDSVPIDDPEGLQDLEGTPEANCDEEDGPINNCFNSSNFLASSTNTAVVENNIDVAANTGRNMAVTEDGVAHVITGDAYAIANVVNIINTNIVGRNWIFALFNVLGNWDGDITFGQSDLALEAKTVAGSVLPGAMVDYLFTITNNGDRDADDIVLKADYDQDLLSFVDAEGEATDTGREWQLPTVRRGESKTFAYQARVGSIPSGTSVTVPVTVSALSDGQGVGTQASFTLATLSVVSPSSGGGGGGGGRSSTKVKTSKDSLAIAPTSVLNPDISVVKEVTRIGTTTPTTVDYKVVVTNNKEAGNLYDGKLQDVLYDPAGAVMYERAWDIGPMAAGEQITLTYSVEFATSTAPGTYRNVATITGNRLGSGRLGKPFDPVDGEGIVTFGTAGAVLGAATDCSLAVSQTLGRGMINPEVAKLQLFLNTQGATLPGTTYFGPLTDAAVRAFQAKYAADILSPIGLSYPTGFVAGMTIKKIRALACNEAVAATASY